MDLFVYCSPTNDYLFLATGENWDKPAVNNACGDGSADAIMQARPIHGVAWDPLEPAFIKDRVQQKGTAGWIDTPGAITMNTYMASRAQYGDAAQATPWVEQVFRLYPIEATHLISYFAHLVQHPGVKINHGVVMGGNTRIGKDSILQAVEYAIGSHNLQNINIGQLFEPFTYWTKCILLRINEAHDTGGDGSLRTQFYERMKIVTAAPPDTLQYNNKNVKPYPVRNCCGVVITTNHPTALYLPRDDCRYFVMWSDLKREDYTADQWREYWDWFRGTGKHAGKTPGAQHVAALLKTWPLATVGFDPKEPPLRTPAWYVTADSNATTADLELLDAIDALGNPDALVLPQILSKAPSNSTLALDLNDRTKAKVWPIRMRGAGFTAIRHPTADQGLWRISGKRSVVYAKDSLGQDARMRAAEALAKHMAIPPAPGSLPIWGA
jgi:hypothetical protein